MKRSKPVSWDDFKRLPIAPRYQTRFIKASDAVELINLWHLSRVATDSRHDHMIWTASEFAKTHPGVTSTGAYKDLDGLLNT